ncbi:hypothetical protein KIPB_006929, partial [Kipferlia bialata]
DVRFTAVGGMDPVHTLHFEDLSVSVKELRESIADSLELEDASQLSLFYLTCASEINGKTKPASKGMELTDAIMHIADTKLEQYGFCLAVERSVPKITGKRRVCAKLWLKPSTVPIPHTAVLDLKAVAYADAKNRVSVSDLLDAVSQQMVHMQPMHPSLHLSYEHARIFSTQTSYTYSNSYSYSGYSSYTAVPAKTTLSKYVADGMDTETMLTVPSDKTYFVIDCTPSHVTVPHTEGEEMKKACVLVTSPSSLVDGSSYAIYAPVTVTYRPKPKKAGNACAGNPGPGGFTYVDPYSPVRAEGEAVVVQPVEEAEPEIEHPPQWESVVAQLREGVARVKKVEAEQLLREKGNLLDDEEDMVVDTPEEDVKTVEAEGEGEGEGEAEKAHIATISYNNNRWIDSEDMLLTKLATAGTAVGCGSYTHMGVLKMVLAETRAERDQLDKPTVYTSSNRMSYGVSKRPYRERGLVINVAKGPEKEGKDTE